MVLNLLFSKKKGRNKEEIGKEPPINLEKIASFFVEKPKAYQFEIEGNCSINHEEPFYTFVKGRFEESKDYEPKCFSVKELENVDEEVYINFCPLEDNAIPIYPFLWEFFQLKREQYPHIKFVVIVIPPRKYGCQEDPRTVYTLRILNDQREFLENFQLERSDISFLSPQLEGLSNALIVLPDPQTIEQDEIKRAIEEYLNIVREKEEETEDFFSTKEEQNIVETKKNVLLEIVEEAYPNVIVPKVWKVRNIVSLFFAIATVVGGIYGFQKYLEWKKMQELKAKKVWVPSKTFKENHFGYIIEVEKQKWAKISELFKPSVVLPREVSADKRKISVIKESPAPLKGFSLRGDKYLKLEIIRFPSYPSWRSLRYKPSKPLKPFKEVYERFKLFVGPNFEIKSFPLTINVNNLKLTNCAQINITRVYPLLETKEFFKALSQTDFILKKVSISKTEGGFSFEVKGFLCGK